MNIESYSYAAKERAKGAFLGAAIGDAMGWPNERAYGTVSRTKKTVEHLPVGLKGWIKRAGGRFFAHEEPICMGEYSDDTQLILSTARSLLKSQQWYDFFSTVELPTWLLYQRGAGSATKMAAGNWLLGKPPWENSDTCQKYFQAGGNGVAMRIIPHSLISAQNDDFKKISKDIFTNGICLPEPSHT